MSDFQYTPFKLSNTMAAMAAPTIGIFVAQLPVFKPTTSLSDLYRITADLKGGVYGMGMHSYRASQIRSQVIGPWVMKGMPLVLLMGGLIAAGTAIYEARTLPVFQDRRFIPEIPYYCQTSLFLGSLVAAASHVLSAMLASNTFLITEIPFPLNYAFFSLIFGLIYFAN